MDSWLCQQKNPHENAFFHTCAHSWRPNRFPPNSAHPLPWRAYDIFESSSKLVQIFWEMGCKIWILPLTLALASNTAYCATAHMRDELTSRQYLRSVCCCIGQVVVFWELNWWRFVTLFTHASCIAAGVGRSVQSRLSVFVRALKGKRLDLAAPKSVDIL